MSPIEELAKQEYKAGYDAGYSDAIAKTKKVLMAAHELSKHYHNHYHYIALQLDEALEKIK